jgi:hypothetical protein
MNMHYGVIQQLLNTMNKLYNNLFHTSFKFDFFICIEMVMCHALICVKGIYQSLT